MAMRRGEGGIYMISNQNLIVVVMQNLLNARPI